MFAVTVIVFWNYFDFMDQKRKNKGQVHIEHPSFSAYLFEKTRKWQKHIVILLCVIFVLMLTLNLIAAK